MAHHKSAKKRIRRNARANVQNSQYMSSVRTAIKKLRAAVSGIAEGTFDKAGLGELFVAAQTQIAKAANKGVLHKNNASRRIGRLAHLVKKADAGQVVATKTTAKKVTKKAAAPAAAKPAAPKAEKAPKAAAKTASKATKKKGE